jgi:hypothetical protein
MRVNADASSEHLATPALGEEIGAARHRKSFDWTFGKTFKTVAVASLALTGGILGGAALHSSIKLPVPVKGVSQENWRRMAPTKQPASSASGAPPLPLGLHADSLRIFVADIPEKFVTGVTGFGKEQTDLQYGYASLGPLVAAEHDLWHPSDHHQDMWFIDQIASSPLRTYDAMAADLIFVPAILDVNAPEKQTALIAEAETFLPHLRDKPHLLVLNHPVKTHFERSKMFNHTNTPNFVFVSWGNLGYVPPAQPWYTVQSPPFSHIHWSRGSKHLRPELSVFDRVQTAALKTQFSRECFIVRHYADRVAVHEDCLERPDLCLHLNYTGAEGAAQINEEFASAWYTLHPQGDTLTRSSFFESLLVESIPVVFQQEYFESVPFTDLLDYRKLMVYIPEETILGENGQNAVVQLADKFNQSEALDRLNYIHDVRHVFQYMRNPVHELIRWNDRATRRTEDDAFTFTMKSVLRNICSRGLLPSQCT